MKTNEKVVPKRAVLKYNICVENIRLEMIGALDEKLSHQNDRLKMIGGVIYGFQYSTFPPKCTPTKKIVFLFFFPTKMIRSKMIGWKQNLF